MKTLRSDGAGVPQDGDWWIVPDELGGGCYPGILAAAAIVKLDVFNVGNVWVDIDALTRKVFPPEPPLFSCVAVASPMVGDVPTWILRRYEKGWATPDGDGSEYLTWQALCAKYGTPQQLILPSDIVVTVPVALHMMPGRYQLKRDTRLGQWRIGEYQGEGNATSSAR